MGRLEEPEPRGWGRTGSSAGERRVAAGSTEGPEVAVASTGAAEVGIRLVGAVGKRMGCQLGQ